jgi:hypothetical protein
MQRDYGTLVNLALQLEKAERAERADIEARYAEALDAFVADLLAERKKADSAIRAVSQDIDEIAELSDAAMHTTFDKVRYDIVNRIEEEAGPTKGQQATLTRLVGIGGVVLTVVLVAGYFGLRQYNAVTVTDPIETRAGIEQRAAALAKVIRYGDWGGGSDSGRRGGFIKGILIWPFEPTPGETEAAREFAGLIFAGATQLGEAKQACNLPITQSEIVSDAEMELLRKVTTHLRNKSTTWGNPPAMTILDPIKASHPC